MWGNAFADMAKKAQEQIQEQAQTLSSAGGMFNLDTLQSDASDANYHGQGDPSRSDPSRKKDLTKREDSSVSEGIVFSRESSMPPDEFVASQSDTIATPSLFSTPTPSPQGKSSIKLTGMRKFPEFPNMGTSVNTDSTETSRVNQPFEYSPAAMERNVENDVPLWDNVAGAQAEPMQPKSPAVDESWDWNEDEIEAGHVKDQELVTDVSNERRSTEATSARRGVQDSHRRAFADARHDTQPAAKFDVRSSLEPSTDVVQPSSPCGAGLAPTNTVDDDDDDLDDMYADDEEEGNISIDQTDSLPSLGLQQGPRVHAVGLTPVVDKEVNSGIPEVSDKPPENGEENFDEKPPVEKLPEPPPGDTAESHVQHPMEEMSGELDAGTWDFDGDDLADDEPNAPMHTLPQEQLQQNGLSKTMVQSIDLADDVGAHGPSMETKHGESRDTSNCDINSVGQNERLPSTVEKPVGNGKTDDHKSVKCGSGLDDESEGVAALESTGTCLLDDPLSTENALGDGTRDVVRDAVLEGEWKEDDGAESVESEHMLPAGDTALTSRSTSETSGLNGKEPTEETGNELFDDDKGHCDIPRTPEQELEAEIASAEDTMGDPVAPRLDGTDQAKKEGPKTLAHRFEVDHTVPESVMEGFAVQMRRLEKHHRHEILEMERRHETKLRETLDSFNHVECHQKHQSMEQRFLAKISEKEERLNEVLRVNEGYQLKLDVMQRELAGTRAILEERDDAMGTASASHSKNLSLLEEKLVEEHQAFTDSKAEIDRLKSALKEARNEAESSNEAFSNLKARVKVVATELKERRVECRTLTSELSELTDVKEQLQTKLIGLQSQLDDRDRNHSEKDEEMDELRSRVDELEDELKSAAKSLKERDAISEKALAAYKKKAQTSLALANARTAAAMQGREEAELDASAARTASEEAIERARVAEANGKAALAEAKDYVLEMETEKADVERKMTTVATDLEDVKIELRQASSQLQHAQQDRDKLESEFATLSQRSQEDRGRNSQLQLDLSEAQRRSNDLYEEVETLREEVRKYASAAFMASNQADGEGESTSGGHQRGTSAAVPTDKSEAEGTIVMLQAELRDANQAIRELKETLRATIEAERNTIHRGMANGSMGPSVADSLQTKPTDGSSFDSHDGLSPSLRSDPRPSSTVGNDATPLFFALEKQAELNTARDEINRLANMLGDAQSEKMEAFEAMEEMRRKMEAAESSLRRYEKLGSGMQERRPSMSSATGLVGGISASGSNAVVSTQNEGVVNLEYLKNVMLSYLNAKSLTERKALVPVVGAVLCLTPEEQSKAMNSVEESGSLEGVGKSLFESIGSQVKPFL